MNRGLNLLELLRNLRRRMLTIGSATGIGWGLALALALLVAGAWFDLVFELPAAVRFAWISLTVISITVPIAAGAIRSLHAGTVLNLAQRLDGIAGSGGQILAGVDLLQSRRQLSPLSGALAELAVAKASSLAATVQESRAVPVRPIRKSFGTFACLFAAGLLLTLLMPRLVWTQWLRFFDPFGDHPPFSRITFNVEPGDAHVVYGTGLDIQVTTDGASIENVQLVLESDGVQSVEKLPMFPAPDGKWTTSLSSVTTPAKYFIRAARSRSRRFRIDVVTVPRLENVRFRITPPEYTNQAPYEGALPQGGLAGLPGTIVQVWAKSNRPLSGGSLEVVMTGDRREQKRLEPAGEHAAEATGSFQIREAGRMQLKVTDVAGQESQDSFTAPITLLADERPFIRVLQPPPVSFATPDTELPVALAAEDDFGISRIQLFRELNGSRPMPQDISTPSLPPRRWTATESLPLSSYGLVPGDAIKLFGRVEDNDPAGAKGFESSVVRVQIISQQDFERMLRQREGMDVLLSKYQQAERRMESLAEEISKLQKELSELDPQSELGDEKRREIEEFAKRLDEEAAAIREAAKHELPYDVDKALSQQLEKLADALAEAAKAAKQTAGVPKITGSQAAEAMKKLGDQLAGDKQEFDQEAIEPLDHLAKIYPLLEDEARFIALYERQRDLAERLASLKGRDNQDDPKLKSRMRDLESEQLQLRNELNDLLADIENHVKNLPDDERLEDLRNSASEFAAAVRTSGASEEMANAEAGLAEFSGTRAHAGAVDAADILEKFLAKCSGGMGQEGEGGRCLTFQPKLSSCLGDSINQLLAEAGLGKGSNSGFGEGTGGGYSSRRSSLQNVGLYGRVPALGQSRTGFGQGRLGLQGLGAESTNRDSSQPSLVDAGGDVQASGAGSATIPLKYRRRVSLYFERIADETGGK
jgi:hypothetical protein